MTLEDRLRHDRLDPALPPDLFPPADLAGTVLRGARRRQLRAPVAVAAALAALAVAVPVAGLGPRGGGTPAAPPTPTGAEPAPPGPVPTTLPALSGGPRTLYAVTSAATGRTALLDPRTGHYRQLPYETVLLSPDLRRVAVSDGDRVGIADRAALLSGGGRAVAWTRLPAGAGLAWSPDGSALLSDELDKAGGTAAHTILRYELRTRAVTGTPVPAGLRLIGTAGWAANSRDYLLLPAAEEAAGTVRPGPLRTLHPDGTLAPFGTGPGGTVDGPASYSPSRRLLVADTSGLMTDGPTPSPVLDARTGAVAGTLPAGLARTVGWYDERTVLRLDGNAVGGPLLLLVDAASGRTVRSVRLPGVPELATVTLGPAKGVSDRAPRF